MQVVVKKQRDLSVCTDLCKRLEWLEREQATVADNLGECVSVEALVQLGSIHAERMCYELLLSQLNN